MSNSILIYGKSWSCKNHPGCLYSIPCNCSNCQEFSDYLDKKYENLPSANKIYQDRRVKIECFHKMLHYHENELKKSTLNYYQ